MSYAQRRLSVTFNLGTGSFGEGKPESNTVSLPNHRITATIIKSGIPSFDQAELSIYGMTPSLMNSLSLLGKPLLYVRNNSVSISAGDDKNGLALIFAGTLMQSWTDFNGVPETFLHVSASVGQTDAMRAVPPTSYPAGADVATVMAGFARQMRAANGSVGLQFENSGVTGVTLSGSYFPGTIREQAERCARHADINFAIDGDTMAIWPKNGSRGGAIPLISKDTGLVGFPGYCSTGITFRTLFNPSIIFGGKVKIQCSLEPANGEWIINALSHDLSSETPGGPWFSTMMAYRVGNPVTVVTR